MSQASDSNGSRPAPAGRSRAPKGFTIEDGREMRRLIEEQNMTANEVAQQYGCYRSTVHYWVVKAGGAWNFRLATRDRERIILLLNKGLTAAAISRETGWSGTTIHRIAREQGIKPGGAKRLPGNERRGTESPYTIVSAARRHGNLARVQRETGLSAAVIEQVLEEHAPEVLRYHIRAGAGLGSDAELIEHNIRQSRSLEEMYKDRLVNWDEVIEDYGLEAVGRWLEEFRAERSAVTRLINQLDKAVERARRPRVIYGYSDGG